MIIGITGATGFIGKALVLECLKHNHQVRILTRTRIKDEISLDNVEVFFGSLTDYHLDLTSFIDGLDLLYHCAGEIHDLYKMEPLHVSGTKRLLASVQSYFKRTNCKIHWIQLSSVGVYGPIRGQPSDLRIVTEESYVRPVGIYEETKAVSDSLVLRAAKNEYLTYTVIRPSNVIGKKMPNKSLYQLGLVIKRGFFFFVGKHDAVGTYVHVSDLIRLMYISRYDIRAKNQVFNLSNDCSLVQMVEAMASALGVNNPRVRVPEFLVRGCTALVSKFIKLPVTRERIDALVTRTSYPCSKLIKELDFCPEISIPDVIKEIVLVD